METEPRPSPVPSAEPDTVGFKTTERLWRVKPRMTGAALYNLGNTCFLNAVLQCLTHTVPLVQSLCFSSHGRRSPCSRRERGFCSFCALREHVDHCLYMTGEVVAPEYYVDNLSKISSSFERGQQEDAHEFLLCLLDSLNNCCLDPDSRYKPPSLQRHSSIEQIFGGRLLSQVKCCNCGHYSDTFEPLLGLSLEIDGVESIEEALDSFTKVEKIEDPDMKFTCEHCKEKVSVEKQFTIEQSPDIVSLHLKRFKINGYFTDKIDNFVKYPLVLDMRPFTSTPEDEEELKYELYAVIVHRGVSSVYGHYYCFIRSSADAWYRMDDSRVVCESELTALCQEAYILFYQKQGLSPSFSSLMKTLKIHADDLNTDTGTSPSSVLDNVEKCRESSYESSSDRESNINNSETPEKGKDVKTSADFCSESVMNGMEVKHVRCPSEASNTGICDGEAEQSTDPPKTQPTTPTLKQNSNKKFHLKPLEIVEGYDQAHSSTELEIVANEAMEQGEVSESLGGLLRSMPSSRRKIIQSYIPPLSLSAPVLCKRKRRLQGDMDRENIPPHSWPGTANVAPASGRKTIPSLLLRNLVMDDDDSDAILQIDSHQDQKKEV